MGRHARIDYDEVSIETPAWLEQRTGGEIDDLTRDLHAWARDHTPDDDPSDDDPAWAGLCPWQVAVLRWCEVRGFTGPEPGDTKPIVINLYGSRLDTELWIARVVALEWGPVAVVQVNDDPPVVYTDTAQTADWYDDDVDIICPAGHGWTWHYPRELTDVTGMTTTLTALFSPGTDAPFTPCPACTAHREGQRRQPCPCDGAWWICCPVCGARCDVHLSTL